MIQQGIDKDGYFVRNGKNGTKQYYDVNVESTFSSAYSTAYEEYVETYDDYPISASNNAKKALGWIKKYGRDVVKAGTRVGLARANQLANKEGLSRDTIARMSAFSRQRKNASINPKYKNEPWKDKGYVAWLLWGGTSGVNWAQKKIKQIDKK